jgi:3-deoxy-D-manno-octulosonic-acid transferase
VFFGPNYQRFREARDLVACGAAISVNNSRDFTDRITLLLSDQTALEDSAAKAGKYVKERTGATSAIINNIAQQLSNIVH